MRVLLTSVLTIFCFWISAIVAAADPLGTVNFDFDSDQLDAEAISEIAALADQIKAIDSYKPTVVVGYTDAVGSLGYNDNLGLRRAQAVANALISAGVPVDRVGTVESRGKRELLIAVSTPERQNRRVTVSLGDILAACRSYRDIPLSLSDVGQELQSDLQSRLVEVVAQYRGLANSGLNGPAYQMSGAAREDCEQAVGYDRQSIRKVEYAQRCFCSYARAQVALGNIPPG